MARRCLRPRGFLDAETFDEGTDDVRAYLAPLWEEWWRIRAREERLILPAAAWRLVRHPSRQSPPPPPRRTGRHRRALQRDHPRPRCRDCGAFIAILQTLRHRYWTAHWNLATSRLAGDIALVGEDRATDLAINAFIPAIPDEETAWQKLAALPVPPPAANSARPPEWLSGGSLKPYRPAPASRASSKPTTTFSPTARDHLRALPQGGVSCIDAKRRSCDLLLTVRGPLLSREIW